ncbi:MFS transporter [Acidisoma cellulosilytica]|uniref:MFS transporter n=1 Tax=Acidisoma cellulosilyticum TaxID=2802395 RepID=A0A964E4M1_9PROT|nr:MFS transporter [Acidisoma cellulosilyticum]MCB8881118.1 MFS transporter [Acidisoma cellulosilyticum]
MPVKRWRIFVFLFTLTSINYIDRVALSVAAKPLSEAFHIGTVEMGYLFSSFIWGYFACLILWGLAADRWGTRTANAAGMAIFSLATIATGFCWNFSSVLVSRLVMGAGEASSFPTGGKIIREWIPASERAFAAASLNGGSYAGPAVGAVIVAAIVSLTGWRGGFIATGLFGFVWLAAWLLIYRKPEEARFLNDQERAFILATRDGARTHLEETSAAGPKIGVLSLLGNLSMWGLLLTQGCTSYSQFLFLTWLPSYLAAARHLTIMKTGLFTALPYAVCVVLGVILGRLSDMALDHNSLHKGRRRLLIVAALILASVIFALPFANSIWLIEAIISLSLTGVSTAITLNIALTNDLLAEAGQAGKATGLLITGGAFFAILAPIVTGYIVAFTGSFSSAFVLAGVILFIGMVSCLTLTRGGIADPRQAGRSRLADRQARA